MIRFKMLWKSKAGKSFHLLTAIPLIELIVVIAFIVSIICVSVVTLGVRICNHARDTLNISAICAVVVITRLSHGTEPWHSRRKHSHAHHICKSTRESRRCAKTWHHSWAHHLHCHRIISAQNSSYLLMIEVS